MNQIFAGSIAFVLALILWGIGKNPKKILDKRDKRNFLNSNNQNNTSLTYKKKEEQKVLRIDELERKDWNQPQSEKERIILKRQLFKLINLGPEERLKSIKLASNWRHSCILPILRRGLKDSESDIVIAAAEAIQKFKHKSNLLHSNSSVRLPRNVFLMR